MSNSAKLNSAKLKCFYLLAYTVWDSGAAGRRGSAPAELLRQLSPLDFSRPPLPVSLCMCIHNKGWWDAARVRLQTAPVSAYAVRGVCA